jgi:hypothetical protein
VEEGGFFGDACGWRMKTSSPANTDPPMKEVRAIVRRERFPTMRKQKRA